MKKITLGSFVTFLREYILMAAGMFLYAFGWIGCIVPAQGVGGGATGFSLVTSHFINSIFDLNIEIGTMVFCVNAVLLLIAGFIVGWNFGVKTIYCIVVMSIAMNMWQGVFAVESTMPHIKELCSGLFELEHVLLVILGGLITALGVAMSFHQGGSTGGTDIVAMIINKYKTISYGRIVIGCDCFIILSATLVGYGIDSVIYGFVMTAVFGYTVDMLMSGSQQSSQLIIITRDPAKMADAITSQIHRGVTMINGMGWYTKEPTQMLMVVCLKRENTTVLKFVKTIDPDAFITVGSVMGVYGKGFQALSKI